ncbi:MAG: hypothetical protein ACOYPR_18695 [Saprospiraceae bacterium]
MTTINKCCIFAFLMVLCIPSLQAQWDTLLTKTHNGFEFTFIAHKVPYRGVHLFSPFQINIQNNRQSEAKLLYQNGGLISFEKGSVFINDSLIVFFGERPGTSGIDLWHYRIKYSNQNQVLRYEKYTSKCIYSNMFSPSLDKYAYIDYKLEMIDINTVKIIYTKKKNDHYYDSDHVLHLTTSYSKFQRFIQFDDLAKATVYKVEPIESTYQWLFEEEYPLQQWSNY